MENWKDRTALLLGDKKLKKLEESHVLIVGLGGVGAYAAEQIARAGIGELTIIDSDKVNPSNINRQLIALNSTIDKDKTSLMQERLLDINPQLKLHIINKFIDESNVQDIVKNSFDYVVDAIDTLTPKVDLITHCVKNNMLLISSMGAGGRLDPAKIQIADISETYNDNLARMIRKRLHKKAIYHGIKVVFSSEKADPNAILLTEGERNKKTTVGTISYMPAIFGNFISSVVIRDLLRIPLK
ncbi:MAG: tRNA threonylcarbamoyladenosine dehydratase [Bacteroidales bacterium]|nr:tRNA threonylcarbamoyladenosine dehydratase [Bacteroidales bacterium]